MFAKRRPTKSAPKHKRVISDIQNTSVQISKPKVQLVKYGYFVSKEIIERKLKSNQNFVYYNRY